MKMSNIKIQIKNGDKKERIKIGNVKMQKNQQSKRLEKEQKKQS